MTIVELRRAKGVTQATLAREVGVSVGTVHRWESGAQAPSWRVLRRVAEFFGVRMNEIEIEVR